MPEFVRCPRCERQLKVPDELIGKNVKCPTCGENFPAILSVVEPTTALSPGSAEIAESGSEEQLARKTRAKALRSLSVPAIFLLLVPIVTLLGGCLFGGAVFGPAPNDNEMKELKQRGREVAKNSGMNMTEDQLKEFDAKLENTLRLLTSGG